MSERWNALKYKKSADKHYRMCQQIVVRYASISRDKDAYVSTLYYLGGYVIECALKSALLESKHDREKFYTKEELASLHLKTHRIEQLFRELQDCVDIDLPNWENFNKTTRDWTENIRYEYPLAPNKHESIINGFWRDVKIVYNALRQNY